MRSFYLASLLLLGSFSNVNAFDFGSIMQAVTPMANAGLSTNPLVGSLTKNLGVTPTQAIGGSAALLNDAKTNMKPADFQSLTSTMPEVGTLLAAAPATTGSVPSQFSALGMKPEMIGKFTPFLLDYIKSGTTPGMMNLVQAALAQ
ncbi:MAG TPA: DUF2780 domain-containing protein [Sulfuricurvum sp.]|nr:MAG: hypothetical protein B7Y30_08850 [Campylobacterales bacterium 16-40-21]OZA01878.1 MAG: hypothetical protein B7X89_11725 [Sulfuricurvum sp. 17-40-25]HQS67547.1 DUF2780 domain-containing protein [Sulfuricurvum sp.]HQT37112.1 DUF2780 domain-containing protein [Sulfuricurvum sp.]